MKAVWVHPLTPVHTVVHTSADLGKGPPRRRAPSRGDATSIPPPKTISLPKISNTAPCPTATATASEAACCCWPAASRDRTGPGQAGERAKSQFRDASSLLEAAGIFLSSGPWPLPHPARFRPCVSLCFPVYVMSRMSPGSLCLGLASASHTTDTACSRFSHFSGLFFFFVFSASTCVTVIRILVYQDTLASTAPHPLFLAVASKIARVAKLSPPQLSPLPSSPTPTE